jgi:hypothetical protein
MLYETTLVDKHMTNLGRYQFLDLFPQDKDAIFFHRFLYIQAHIALVENLALLNPLLFARFAEAVALKILLWMEKFKDLPNQIAQ